VCLLAVAFLGSAAQAAPTPSDQQKIERQQEQIIRREQEQRRELERQRKLRELKPPKPEEEEEPQIDGLDGRCAQVDRIDLQGLEELGPEPYRAIVDEFEGRCLTIEQMQGLLTLLNDAFRDAGYVTTRAYLAPQDMTDGILVITIVEGRIEDLSLNEDDPGDRSQLFFAFPTEEDEVLNLRDVEQGLDQMNRLASNNAKMQIQPGSEPGTSVIAVSNDVGDRFRFELGRDNSGSTPTGKLQNVASFSADNVLSFNDGWTVNYSRNARDYDDAKRSESLSGTFSLPFGYSTLTCSGSYYRYNNLVNGEVEDFLTTGISTSNKLELSHILHRDQGSKTRFDVSVTAKRTRNYIEDALVEVNSRDLSVGRLALAHSNRVLDGVASIEIGHERGLRILGAKEDDEGQPNDDPKAQFRKWTLDVTYYRPIAIGEQTFTWNSTTSWQYAPDTLFGSERIGVGGQYSVRGFRDDTLAGDTGGYWRNEVAWRLPEGDWGALQPVMGRIEPYVALDWGWIRKDRSEDREKGVLSGWSVGLRNVADYASFDVTYSKALDAPHFLDVEDHEINFRAVVRF